MTSTNESGYPDGQCPSCLDALWSGREHVCGTPCPPTNPANDRPVGRKDDLGKLRFDLVPAVPLEDLARIYTYGSQKYADRNWEKGIEWGRIFAAMMRHLWAFWRGETVDLESGMPHMAHAAWGCFTLLEYMRTHPELDDRPRQSELVILPGRKD